MNAIKNLTLLLSCCYIIFFSLSVQAEGGGSRSYNLSNGDKYVGQWKDDNKHGEGIYTTISGDKYVGQFKDDKKHGEGIYTTVRGDKYVGQFKDDKKHGEGTFTLADGDKYVGQFKDGKKHGEGIYTTVSGDKYVGQFKDDKPHGKGTFTLASGYKYAGQFKEGKRHGKGVVITASGDKHVGQFKDDTYVGPFKENNATDKLLKSIKSNGGIVVFLKKMATLTAKNLPQRVDAETEAFSVSSINRVISFNLRAINLERNEIKDIRSFKRASISKSANLLCSSPVANVVINKADASYEYSLYSKSYELIFKYVIDKAECHKLNTDN